MEMAFRTILFIVPVFYSLSVHDLKIIGWDERGSITKTDWSTAFEATAASIVTSD